MGDILLAILGFIAEGFAWLLLAVVWMAVKLFLLLSDAVLALFSAIPVPEFMEDMGVHWDALPEGVWFFLAPLQFATALSWLVSAYILRFTIRRLPFVG